MSVATILARLVAACTRRAWTVTLIGLALIAGSAALATSRLSLSSDLNGLFAASLPWRQRAAALHRDFPQFNDPLLVVIEARIPEEADATAAALAGALAADTSHFRQISRPGSSPFFEREGFLFLDRDQLGTLLDRTIDAQPFLGQLAADPSARGLFAALSLVATGVQRGEANLAPFAPALRGFHDNLAAAAAGHPRNLSWEELLAGPVAALAGHTRFVLAQPVLDYGAVQPGGAATAALREAAARLEYVRDGGARVRVTGTIALADEEFASAAHGAVQGLLASTALVIVWLFLALRSWRLILPVMLTLLLGLALTTGFATLAVGTLNLISIAFAILFVGIAVDFGIQFSARFREARAHQPDLHTALALAAYRSGGQILVAASATAAGFLAFVPTAFSGVAQLGLIAGVGMLIAFACTLSFLPAAMAVCRPRPDAGEAGLGWARPLDRAVVRLRLPILLLLGAASLAGAVLLPRIAFDGDPLHTKNPQTEAMQTLYGLMDDPRTNPYSIDIMRPDPASATALAGQLKALPLVRQVVTLGSFVPADQPTKLALIADAANLLGPTLAARTPAAPVSAADLRLAVRAAAAQIDAVLPKLGADDPLRAIAGDLRSLQDAPDARLLAMNDALTRFLPTQLDRLRAALDAQPVGIDRIPPDVARDWTLPDGRTRVQVTGLPDTRGAAGLRRFVDAVQAVAPDASGPAVTIVETTATVVGAFRQAVIGAVAAIGVILLLALRSPLTAGLVLLPLLASACLVVLCSVLLPLPLNFANVIALPLLLGVGVSFNIYFVMNWRAGQDHPLGSATARAVVFSALTTGTAFGSLALSEHPGTASMGRLLLLSLGCTLVVTLAFVPALLASLRRPRG